jgi:hypothetical protein
MKFLGLLVLLLIVSGCATIISGTTDNVLVKSTPSGVPFTIQNKSGVTVVGGVTPTKVQLKRGDGYFNDEVYKVNYVIKGFYPQTSVIAASINPWYFGNLIFGGIIIGGIIIDPLTGAMWSFPSDTNILLFPIQ